MSGPFAPTRKQAFAILLLFVLYMLLVQPISYLNERWELFWRRRAERGIEELMKRSES
jgi:type II secretory pathway component PulM